MRDKLTTHSYTQITCFTAYKFLQLIWRISFSCTWEIAYCCIIMSCKYIFRLTRRRLVRWTVFILNDSVGSCVLKDLTCMVRSKYARTIHDVYTISSGCDTTLQLVEDRAKANYMHLHMQDYPTNEDSCLELRYSSFNRERKSF